MQYRHGGIATDGYYPRGTPSTTKKDHGNRYTLSWKQGERWGLPVFGVDPYTDSYIHERIPSVVGLFVHSFHHMGTATVARRVIVRDLVRKLIRTSTGAGSGWSTYHEPLQEPLETSIRWHDRGELSC